MIITNQQGAIDDFRKVEAGLLLRAAVNNSKCRYVVFFIPTPKFYYLDATYDKEERRFIELSDTSGKIKL